MIEREYGSQFLTLLSVLEKERPVFIQTHDFPDHDAVGAAYALSVLLHFYGFKTQIGYGGLIQDISLQSLIKFLEIELTKIEEAGEENNFQVIIVDGSPFKGPIETVAGELKAVIDHHQPKAKSSAPFTDIRAEIGSCSSIIWSYWKTAEKEIDGKTASALLAGIQLDTHFLSRKVTEMDLDAHYEVYQKGDAKEVNKILRTTVSIGQLEKIGKAFSSYLLVEDFILVEVKENYSSAILSVLSDFLIWIKEVRFAVVIEVSGERYKLSARSRDTELNAGYMIYQATKKIGAGGGHANMAGGFVLASKYPGKKEFLKAIIKKSSSKEQKEPLWKRIFRR